LLTRALRDSNEVVRQYAVAGLRKIDTPQAHQALRAYPNNWYTG
jgi:hypothetical protein